MPDHRRGDAATVGAGAAVLDSVREDRERHADVRCEPALARRRRGDRERGVVARLPQPRARLDRSLDLEGGYALPAEDLARGSDLVIASVELDEEARSL